jgi:TonB-dependent starch-binding outer membrane protein SusC
MAPVSKTACLLLLATTFLSASLAFSSEYITVTGKVLDSGDSQPIPGASVIIPGTLVGAATGFDGDFELSVPDSTQYIQISSIGYQPKSIALSAGVSGLVVMLETETVGIGEIVISVPYSRQSSDTYTGSATVFRPGSSASAPTSVDKMLQGNSAGLTSNSGTGQPGAASELRLRGAGSISASSAPLFVVDGIPLNSSNIGANPSSPGEQLGGTSAQANPLEFLNPNDIESITILKDASATALYGARASNGVIMITTKKGAEGKTKFSLSANSGLSMRINPSFRMMNSEEYRAWRAAAFENAGIGASLDYMDASTDWMDEVFRLAYSQSYNASAAGGSATSTYYLSGSYKSDEGIVEATSHDLYSARANITHKANSKIEIGSEMAISAAEQHGTRKPGDKADLVTAAYIARPDYPVRNTDGSFFLDANFANPAALAQLDINRMQTNRVFANAYAKAQICNSVSFKTIVNYDMSAMDSYMFLHPATPDGKPVNGIGSAVNAKQQSLTSSNTLSWDKKTDSHSFGIVAGYEAGRTALGQNFAAASNFASPSATELSAASNPIDVFSHSEEHRIISALSSANYGYKGRYYLSASARYDGSSKFSPKHRYAPFWSAGISWRISEESFMQGISWIDNLKLRASYGTSGNSDIRPYAYLTNVTHIHSYSGKPGSAVTNLGNENLTWEKNATSNLGLDFRVMRRISGSMDFYRRYTYDLLLEKPLPPTSGHQSQMENIGALSNTGAELSIAAQAISKQRTRWTVEFNIGANRSKVEKLYQNQDIIQGATIQREGQAYNSFYLADWAGVDHRTGAPLWHDSLGRLTLDYSQARKVIAGSPEPKFTAGLSNTLKIGKIDISAMLYASYGNYIYNNTKRAILADGAQMGFNQSLEATAYWQKPGDTSVNPKPSASNTAAGNQSSTRYLEDGSYLRLKAFTLGYSIHKLKNRQLWDSARIYAQATNIFTWTKYSGIDPEVNARGVDFFSYPNAIGFFMGLSLDF